MYDHIHVRSMSTPVALLLGNKQNNNTETELILIPEHSFRHHQTPEQQACTRAFSTPTLTLSFAKEHNNACNTRISSSKATIVYGQHAMKH